MTVVADRIARLRALMAEKGIDAYVVPTADFHQSEYVGEHLKQENLLQGSADLTEPLSSEKMMPAFGQMEDISSRQSMKWKEAASD